jgi:hypothetical protein
MSADDGPALNPYTPGVGTQPPVLVGRDLQLAVIEQTARLVEGGQEPQHVILSGLRGVGKTVLVKEGMRRLRARGWLCGYYEVRRDVDAGLAIAAIVAGGASLLPKRAKLTAALRKLRASIGSASLSGSADGTVSISINPLLVTTHPYFEALRLFQPLAAAPADDNVGVAHHPHPSLRGMRRSKRARPPARGGPSDHGRRARQVQLVRGEVPLRGARRPLGGPGHARRRRARRRSRRHMGA